MVIKSAVWGINNASVFPRQVSLQVVYRIPSVFSQIGSIDFHCDQLLTGFQMPDQILLLACLAGHFYFVNRLFNLIAQRLILRIAIKGYWFFFILIIKFETI